MTLSEAVIRVALARCTSNIRWRYRETDVRVGEQHSSLVLLRREYCPPRAGRGDDPQYGINVSPFDDEGRLIEESVRTIIEVS